MLHISLLNQSPLLSSPFPSRLSLCLFAVTLQNPSLSMAAEVTSLFRNLSGYKEDHRQIKSEESNFPITRDLLGGCSTLGSKELDLDLQIPNGWEKRLDLKSGKAHLHHSGSPSKASLSSSDPKVKVERAVPELQDLNFPPNHVAEEGVDLKLFPSAEYQSVCTLDKVKSALERAGRESGKKRSFSSEVSPSRICPSPSSPSVKGGGIGDGEEEEKSAESVEPGLVFAAACPSCLLYVLISKASPKCPRCDTVVPFLSLKKPKIDLNS